MRLGHEQILGPGMKSALGFELQKAGHVRLGQFGHLGLQGQNPVQRQAYGATALANARLVEMIANFLPGEFRITRQWRQRQRHSQRLLHLQRPVQAAHHHGFEAVAVQGKAEDRRRDAFFENVREWNHLVFCVSSQRSRTCFPSAQPR